MAGFLDALARFFAPPPNIDMGVPLDRVVNLGPDDSRSLGPWDVWGTNEPTTNTIAGVAVSADTAMNAPAVWACVRLISGAISGLPLHAYRGTGNDRKQINLPQWLEEPVPSNPNVTRMVHIQQVVTSMLLEGNAFVLVLPSVDAPNGLRVLPPHEVVIETQDDGTDIYEWNDRRLTARQVMHIPYVVVPGKSRGLNPVDAAKETIGLSIAADQYGASYFGSGLSLSIGLKWPVGAEPSPDELEKIKKSLRKEHGGPRKSHGIGALTNGGEFVDLSRSHRDSQLLELREFQVEDIGRMYGVPPHMIGSQKPGAVAYASVEQRNIDFVTHGLQPVIEKLEDAYERVLRGQRTYFKFSVEGLLRGDTTARWTAYDKALQNKVIRREEVRAKEDLPFDPEGVGYLETPNNNAPEEPAEQEPAA